MTDTLYLLFWKPQVGLPVALGQFEEAAAATSRLGELVNARTASGDWRDVPLPRQYGAERREALLRGARGQVESYYISEHHTGATGRAAAYRGVHAGTHAGIAEPRGA